MGNNQPSEGPNVNEYLAGLKEKYNEGAISQAEMQEKVDNINFIIDYCSADKELKNALEKELEQYKKLRKIDLTKSLNGKKYPTTTKIH